MSVWRREAIRRFPELHREIADALNATEMWWPLWEKFTAAYRNEPPDRETIARVYNYADWCLRQRSNKVGMDVILNFYERLHDDLVARRDMPRWMPQSQFDTLHFAWEYSTKQPFADLRQEFVQNKARIEKEKERQSVPHNANRAKRQDMAKHNCA